MNQLNDALRKKNNAPYVDSKSACVGLDRCRLKWFLTLESKRDSRPADTFAQNPKIVGIVILL